MCKTFVATVNLTNEVDFKNLDRNKTIKLKSECTDKTHLNVRIVQE